MLLGALFILGNSATIVIAMQSKAWPSVTGTVITSKVIKQVGGGRGGSRVSYSPEIKYAYQVGDKACSGTHIWVLDHGGSEARAKNLVAEFPSGASAAVFYEPSSPTRSVLKPGTDGNMFSSFGMSLLLFVAAMAVCPIWKPFLGRKLAV